MGWAADATGSAEGFVTERVYRRACPEGTCGECPRCWMRRAWAEGRYKKRGKPVRGDHWTPEQDAMLARLVGTVPREQLQAVWLERTGIQRTLEALRVRCVRLGISMWAHGWSMRDLEAIFGADHRVIARHWVKPGYLKASRWNGRGKGEGWWFDESDLEQFVREYGWLYDWRRMKPGHRLTQLAELVNRSDPWRTYEELMAYVGLAKTNLDRWKRLGLVPHQRRPKGGGWRIMVRGRDFPAIRAAILQARAEARERARQKASLRMRNPALRDHRGKVIGKVAA